MNLQKQLKIKFYNKMNVINHVYIHYIAFRIVIRFFKI